MKKWLNDVILLDGIKFPYALDEIKTEVKFQQGSMHAFMEIEKNFANYLEDEFWDEAYKEKHGRKHGGKKTYCQNKKYCGNY